MKDIRLLTDAKLILSKPIIPKSIFFFLVFLSLWQIAVGFIRFFSLESPVNQAPAFPTQTIQVSLKAALTTPLFGDYVPQNLGEADVKQSVLDLTVVGIMFSNKEGASHVIIRTAGGREQTFSVGDSLPGGAIIKRITPDGVLIKRNGVLESLSLPKNDLNFEGPPKPLPTSD
jgi:general secretion pathway protein C